MRMRKITETKERPTLETAVKDFISIKQAQMISEETLHDYKVQLGRFIRNSHNSTEYSVLEQDTLAFLLLYQIQAPHGIISPISTFLLSLAGW